MVHEYITGTKMTTRDDDKQSEDVKSGASQ